MKLAAIALLSVFAALVHASPASACVCGSFATFEENAREAGMLATGRVTAIGELKNDEDPESIDVDVEWVGKGAVTASSIRVWNTLAGSSCGGDFKDLKIGSLVALVLDVVKPPMDEAPFDLDPDAYEAIVHPVVGDYAVINGCTEGHKLFRTKRDRDRWIAKALK